MARDFGKANGLEHGLKMALFRGGKFNELKAIKANGIFKQVSHNGLQSLLVAFVTNFGGDFKLFVDPLRYFMLVIVF